MPAKANETHPIQIGEDELTQAREAQVEETSEHYRRARSIVQIAREKSQRVSTQQLDELEAELRTELDPVIGLYKGGSHEKALGLLHQMIPRAVDPAPLRWLAKLLAVAQDDAAVSDEIVMEVGEAYSWAVSSKPGTDIIVEREDVYREAVEKLESLGRSSIKIKNSISPLCDVVFAQQNFLLAEFEHQQGNFEPAIEKYQVAEEYCQKPDVHELLPGEFKLLVQVALKQANNQYQWITETHKIIAQIEEHIRTDDYAKAADGIRSALRIYPGNALLHDGVIQIIESKIYLDPMYVLTLTQDIPALAGEDVRFQSLRQAAWQNFRLLEKSRKARESNRTLDLFDCAKQVCQDVNQLNSYVSVRILEDFEAHLNQSSLDFSKIPFEKIDQWIRETLSRFEEILVEETQGVVEIDTLIDSPGAVSEKMVISPKPGIKKETMPVDLISKSGLRQGIDILHSIKNILAEIDRRKKYQENLSEADKLKDNLKNKTWGSPDRLLDLAGNVSLTTPDGIDSELLVIFKDAAESAATEALSRDDLGLFSRFVDVGEKLDISEKLQHLLQEYCKENYDGRFANITRHLEAKPIEWDEALKASLELVEAWKKSIPDSLQTLVDVYWQKEWFRIAIRAWEDDITNQQKKEFDDLLLTLYPEGQLDSFRTQLDKELKSRKQTRLAVLEEYRRFQWDRVLELDIYNLNRIAKARRALTLSVELFRKLVNEVLHLIPEGKDTADANAIRKRYTEYKKELEAAEDLWEEAQKASDERKQQIINVLFERDFYGWQIAGDFHKSLGLECGQGTKHETLPFDMGETLTPEDEYAVKQSIDKKINDARRQDKEIGFKDLLRLKENHPAYEKVDEAILKMLDVYNPDENQIEKLRECYPPTKELLILVNRLRDINLINPFGFLESSSAPKIIKAKNSNPWVMAIVDKLENDARAKKGDWAKMGPGDYLNKIVDKPQEEYEKEIEIVNKVHGLPFPVKDYKEAHRRLSQDDYS